MTAAEASRAEPEAGRAEAGRAELSAIRRLWARAQRTEAWRAWQRYGVAQGGLLAAGIGYFSFFSLFPADVLEKIWIAHEAHKSLLVPLQVGHKIGIPRKA